MKLNVMKVISFLVGVGLMFIIYILYSQGKINGLLALIFLIPLYFAGLKIFDMKPKETNAKEIR